jgi:putative SOS response-associated peptidase YedK
MKSALLHEHLEKALEQFVYVCRCDQKLTEEEEQQAHYYRCMIMVIADHHLEKWLDQKLQEHMAEGYNENEPDSNEVS